LCLLRKFFLTCCHYGWKYNNPHNARTLIMLTNKGKKLYQKRIEYCLFRICNSNFCLFSISFFTDDTMFLTLIKRHFKDTRCFYIVFFECPTLRLLAGLVDDWQITFKKFLDVRCAECNGFYRISSLWQPWCSLFWSAAIDWCICIFFYLSLLRYRMVPQ